MYPINNGRMRMSRSVEGETPFYSLNLLTYNMNYFLTSADLIFQKSAKKRAEAAKMIEKEISAMAARQEKVDHKLKERIGELSRGL